MTKECITREECIAHIEKQLELSKFIGKPNNAATRTEIAAHIETKLEGIVEFIPANSVVRPKRNLFMRVIMYLPNLYRQWRDNRDLEIWANTPKICDMCVGNFTWGELYACSGDAWLCPPCLYKYMHMDNYPTLEITNGPRPN